MIIECGQCLTKFRFDDALMRAEGIWVRCGVCQYEFFQADPDATRGVFASAQRSSDLEPAASGRQTPAPEKGDPAPVKEQEAIPEEEPENVPGQEKKRSSIFLKILVLVLLVLIVSAGVGYMAFPDLTQKTTREWAEYIPWLKKQPPSVHESVRIDAVNQRFVNNLFAGAMRVVEGAAVNESGKPLARVQMKALLMDDANKQMGEKHAFAGNVLSDTELTILTEEEINQRLANPQGSTAPNDRVMPGGRIPFMIVVAREQPGIAKVFVAVADAERLPQ